MMTIRSRILSAALCLLLPVTASAAAAVDGGLADAGVPANLVKAAEILKRMEEVDRAAGDSKKVIFVQEKNGKETVNRETLVYSRVEDYSMIVLVTGPKTQAGNGFLRIESNLWSYDAALGRWDRRTERDRVAGTDTRASDFAPTAWTAQYDLTGAGEETIGGVKTRWLTVKAKEGIDVPSPVVKVWVDAENRQVKKQEFALSGKLVRTALLPKWAKATNKALGKEFAMPKEVRIFDEVDKGRTTTLLLKSAELAPLDKNIFTKAWFEGKSR